MEKSLFNDVNFIVRILELDNCLFFRGFYSAVCKYVTKEFSSCQFSKRIIPVAVNMMDSALNQFSLILYLEVQGLMLLSPKCYLSSFIVPMDISRDSITSYIEAISSGIQGLQ